MFPPWLPHGVLPTKATIHENSFEQRHRRSKTRVALSFNYGWNWQYNIDNSLLDFDQCSTEHLLKKGEIGIYVHGSGTKELIDIDVNVTHEMTTEQVKMEYSSYGQDMIDEETPFISD